jgi:P27 family predicted phage terminase small subunit
MHKVPTNLKVLRGNPGQRRIRPIPEPPPLPTVPEPPDYLTGHARAEWERVVPGLHGLGLLTALDIQPLAAYCQAYALWRSAVDEFAKAAADSVTAGLLVPSGRAGALQRNPLAKIAADAASDMLSFAGHFGLSPLARSRIGVGTKPPPSKFGDLIA